MSIRLLALPGDLSLLSGMIVETFQYPENPEWSVQDDQREQLVEAIRGLRRTWPLIRAIQTVSPSLRDILRGFVWDEDGQAVGVVIYSRQGKTQNWYISTVGVLPGFRRRGIARRLVTRALEDIRTRRGERTTLGVIEENLPARSLYESLGFEAYAGTSAYHLLPEDRVKLPAPSLPRGFRSETLRRFDWRSRYNLEKRIAPDAIRRFEPVTADRFRQPTLMRVLLPVVEFAQKSRDRDFAVYKADGGTIVARGGYTLSTSGKGTHSLRVRLDPAHSELAPYLMGRLLFELNEVDRALRVELGVASWMPPVAAEAESLGFRRRLTGLQMGIDLSASRPS
jgi:ribosomal protein S18 acetylase RimI-like enzyme